ncbi:cell division protein FtsL [Endozoicomonas montiporae]|uniref:Cell division protein FtsL n=1 Tax=Endozoicomonas montiporae CL-33 TaxID=570277 RepID=A0A142BEK3_9GAMM|nr:cell division protein FtsL [Endozoicomonas montiporae]AMO57179.1 cell division protein FtsL [Endozoicomonas montiporae CL-33]
MDKEPLLALFNRTNALVAGLLLLVLASGVAVSFVGHENRRLHNVLQQEQENLNTAQIKWGKLLLEHGMLTSPGRIESLARGELGMNVPDSGRIEVVAP